MKYRPNPLIHLTAAASLAFGIAPAAYAQVVSIDNQTFHYGTLLTDNFNTPSYNWYEFNNSLAADQGGTLATVAYSTSNGNDYTAQHSNGGNMLLTSDGWGGWGAMASPNHNFATTANTTNKPLEIQFDMSATGGDAPDWIGFGLNAGQGQLFYEGVYGFAATVGDGNHNYKLVISDAAGTGSGFNGITDGAKIEFYKDNVLQQTITETLGTSDGYITFRTIPSLWTGWNIGVVDNLKITSGQQTNPLATSSELNLNNNGSLNFGDVTQTVAKLDGTAGTTVKLLNSSLTVDGSVDSTFAGVISGSAGSLTKNGSGTLTLSGANTYSGGTTVSAGTLILDGASGGTSRIAGNLTVNSGATVALTNGDTTGLGYNTGAKVTSLTINGGTVTTAGVTHIWNYAGGVNMTGGTLQSNNGVSDANGSQLEWINADVVTYASADTATIGGRIRMRGDGGATGINFTVADGATTTDLLVSAAVTEASAGLGITKNGSGTMMLSGTNTYTGATTVSAGTLLVTGQLDSSAVIVGSTATIAGSGSVGSLAFAPDSFFDIFMAIGNPLDVTGTISFSNSGFGIDNLTGVDWGDVANGTYTLATGTLDSTNLGNLGLVNAYDLGGGRSAYFQSGSLQLVVIPEPRAALLGSLGMLALLRRRR